MTKQIARAAEGEKYMANSSLRKEEHKRTKRTLHHSNREREEREMDFWGKGLLGFWREKTSKILFSEEKGLDLKGNSGLILGEGKSLKRDF